MRTDIVISTYYNYMKDNPLVFPDLPDLGNYIHAEDAMKIMGITYQKATAHPVGDYWRFYDCTNVPDVLPAWASRYEITDTPPNW